MKGALGAFFFFSFLSLFFCLDTSSTVEFSDGLPIDVNNKDFYSFFRNAYTALELVKTPTEWFTTFLSNIQSLVFKTTTKNSQSAISINDDKVKDLEADPYPFWKFLPAFEAAVIPGGPEVTWSAPCFKNNTAKAIWKSADEAVIEMRVEEATSRLCNDYYLFGTMSGISLKSFFFRGSHSITWKFKNFTAADKWDVTQNGFRIFRFIVGETEAVKSLYDTVELFLPALLNQAVPEKTAELNLNFLANYAQVTMAKRTIQQVPINESEIHSGDFLGVIRLDGLDPLLAWGMGANTGHTTIALRFDGELYICESTTNSKYWPTNGIQRTPYAKWIEQAKAASYNVVWLPLSADARAKFDEKKAADWFLKTAQGLPYGFHNMLFTWIDTFRDNYPCLPPTFSEYCLTPELVQVGAGFFDKIDAKLGTLMFNQALNKRAATTNLPTVDVAYAAAQKGISWEQLLVLPEQDSWVYNDGYSMVCDVLVCETWKAGGLFGALTDQIQCTEFTNWDAYALKIFDGQFARPQACVDADPDQAWCQILGEYRLALPGWNTKTFYPHMGEKCPSLAPKYIRPATC